MVFFKAYNSALRITIIQQAVELDLLLTSDF